VNRGPGKNNWGGVGAGGNGYTVRRNKTGRKTRKKKKKIMTFKNFTGNAQKKVQNFGKTWSSKKSVENG